MILRFNVLKYAYLIGLFLLPFVFWPQAKIAYEIPKVWFFERWVELLAIIAVLNIPFLVKKEMDRKLIFGFFLFLILAVLSSLLGSNFLKSLFGNYYRLDGLITLFHLVLLLIVTSVYWTDKWQFSLATVISASSSILSAYTVYLGFRYYFFSDQLAAPFGRAIGATFGQPNFLAGFLLIVLPFLEFKRKTSRYKLLWLCAEILQMIAIILTLSRAGILGICLWIGIMIVIQNWKKTHIKKLLLFLFVIFCFSLVFYLKAFPLKYSNLYPESRTRVLVHGLLAVVKRPFFGWGWANFDYAFSAVSWPYKFQNDIYYDKAHSNLLEVLTTTGIFGLACYIFLIMRIFQNLFKKIVKSSDLFSEMLMIIFLLFIIHSQTNVLSINEELFFWLIGGIAVQRRG